MTIIKRIAYTASLLAALTASLTSCDIASDDRFILEDKVVPQRNVLLMDFTGQGCINCPNAHDVMSELSKQYNTDGKTNLITVSIHAGAQAMSVDRTDFSADRIGLMIAEGQEMNDAFSINAWPTGAVDHINGKDNALLYAEWPAAVRTAFEKPTDINIEATATLTDDRIEVSTNVHSTSDQDIALQVWVIENGIKASQRLPDRQERQAHAAEGRRDRHRRMHHPAEMDRQGALEPRQPADCGLRLPWLRHPQLHHRQSRPRHSA